jgi:uncharacterized membrane protein
VKPGLHDGLPGSGSEERFCRAMAEIVKSIDIDAPVETVFEFVINPHNALKYMANFSKFQPIGQPEQGLGAKVDAAGSFLGMHIHTQLEIVEFEQNKKFMSRSSSGVKSQSTWFFRSLPSGSTEVTFASEYTVPGRKLGWLLDKLLVEKDVEKNTVETLVNLKKAIEGKPNLRVADLATW